MERIQLERPDSPAPSCVSMQSDHSKGGLIDLKDQHPSSGNIVHQEGSEAAQKHQTDLESTFRLPIDAIVTFVKNELKIFQGVLNPDYTEDSEGQKKKEDVVDNEEEAEQRRSSREALLKITLNILRMRKQEELADCLQSNACELTLDPNTVNSNLSLSKDNKKVAEVSEKLRYPDHPERFQHWKQVLCREGLTSRCYWEVEWNGWVNIGVAYKGIKRKGQDDDCWIGQNDKSWSLLCCDKFSACHKNRRVIIPTNSSFDADRVAVYLDWPAGTLSFYRVSSDRLVHLHTFQDTFTEPLYPAFGIELKGESISYISLCQI